MNAREDIMKIFWWKDLTEIDCLEDLGMDWRIILIWVRVEDNINMGACGG
jgi:hypothetical protein